MDRDGKFHELESPSIKRMEFLKASVKIGERSPGSIGGLPAIIPMAGLPSAPAVDKGK
jgi:hypothetical protein